LALSLSLCCLLLLHGWSVPPACIGQGEQNASQPARDPLKDALGTRDISLQRFRFEDNGDGTVTDNRTGLVWLKHADCFGALPWAKAIEIVQELADGAMCDGMELRDGSSPGDWRLPTIREIMTLPVIDFFNPALSNAMGTSRWREGDAFLQVSTQYYWSSTGLNNGSAWYMYLYNGSLGISDVSQRYSVWPVKGELSGIWDLGS
jgi:hypothetical protein